MVGAPMRHDLIIVLIALLLTGGYGSAIGAFFGAIIFGMVVVGLTYTGFDQDWFQVFLWVEKPEVPKTRMVILPMLCLLLVLR